MDRKPSGRWTFAARNAYNALPLWFDPKVPLHLKLVPFAAILYAVFPIDLIPDPILGLGQIDDLAVILISLKLFVDLAQSARDRHQSKSGSTVEGSYRVID